MEISRLGIGGPGTVSEAGIAMAGVAVAADVEDEVCGWADMDLVTREGVLLPELIV